METRRAFSEAITDVFGEIGAQWLAALPALLLECEERWEVSIEAPFPLSYNYVAPARCLDGTDVVVKLGVPNWEFGSEIAALRHYAGRGAVALLDADAGRGVMLLERVHPGTPLADLDDDEAMTDIACGVMLDLWRPPPEGHAFRSVEKLAGGLQRLRRRFEGGSGPLPADLLALAESQFANLLASSSDPVLLHGDVHHGNILRAERQPWLAIDPKGVVGDRGYELGAFLRNNVLHLNDPKRALNRRVDQFAERLSMDTERIRAWGVAFVVLSASWSVEDHGSGWEPAIAVARLLLEH